MRAGPKTAKRSKRQHRGASGGTPPSISHWDCAPGPLARGSRSYVEPGTRGRRRDALACSMGRPGCGDSPPHHSGSPGGDRGPGSSELSPGNPARYEVPPSQVRAAESKTRQQVAGAAPTPGPPGRSASRASRHGFRGPETPEARCELRDSDPIGRRRHPGKRLPPSHPTLTAALFVRAHFEVRKAPAGAGVRLARDPPERSEQEQPEEQPRRRSHVVGTAGAGDAEAAGGRCRGRGRSRGVPGGGARAAGGGERHVSTGSEQAALCLGGGRGVPPELLLPWQPPQSPSASPNRRLRFTNDPPRHPVRHSASLHHPNRFFCLPPSASDFWSMLKQPSLFITSSNCRSWF